MTAPETIPREKKGCLTLMNFLTIVFVLFILAALAIPDFMNMLEKRRGSGECKTNLGAIYVAQTAYRAEHGVFAMSPGSFEKIGWWPQGKNEYSYFCGDDMIACHPDKCNMDPVTLGPDWPIPVKPYIREDSFLCVAVGNVDRDETKDVFTINEQKDLRTLINDVND